MKIGITAPGSSTHFMVQYLMARHELKPDDAAYIAVGTGPSAIAAARRGEIDAIVNVDPVIAVLESQRLIRVVADTRTVEGTRAVYGGPYPAAVLYATATFIERNPRTVQALVNAFVRGLRLDARPFAGGDRPRDARGVCARRPRPLCPFDPQQLADLFPRWAFYAEGAEIALRVLRAFDPARGQRRDRPGQDLYRSLRRQRGALA